MLFLFCSAQLSGAGGWFQVTARSGLHIRSKPDTSAPVLGALSWGSRVRALERSDRISSVGTLRAYWHRIISRGTVGWVFGAYLQPTSPPADAGLTGALFSWGLGCSGHTYSEYLVVLRFLSGSRVQLGKYFTATPNPEGKNTGFFSVWDGSWSASGGTVSLQFTRSRYWVMASDRDLPVGPPRRTQPLWLYYRLSFALCTDEPNRCGYRAPALDAVLNLAAGQMWVDVTRRSGRVYGWLVELMKKKSGF